MSTALVWTVAIGIAFHLFGAGDIYTHLAGSILVILFAVGGIVLITSAKTQSEVLTSLVFSALALVLIPVLMSVIIREIWGASWTG